MSESGRLLGVWLDELVIGDESGPEVVLSLFAEGSAARRLTSGERLDVGVVRAVIERQTDQVHLRLHWQIGNHRHEQRVDFMEQRQRELLRRLAMQPLFPLVISGTRGQSLEVYDYENPFRQEENEAGAWPVRARLECLHRRGRRHSRPGSN